MLKLEKLAFIETLSSVYRGDGRQSEDESQIHSGGSLADIASDIVSFIRNQKKRLAY